jgi:hypothetical protein
MESMERACGAMRAWVLEQLLLPSSSSGNESMAVLS